MINYDFSIITNPSATSSIALRTVYVLDADPTYDVKKTGAPNTDLIALRTTEGIGCVKIEGLPEINVLPDTLLFFRHTDVRRYYCSGDKWGFWWFEFACDDMLNIPINTLLMVNEVENELNDCRTCLELLRKNQRETSFLASASLGLLIYKWKLNLENKKNINPHNHNVQKSIAHMRANFFKDITVKTLASISGLCERRFRQVFVEVTGHSPKKYMDLLRISMAEELLKNTPFSINQLSEKLGYSSQFHFCKDFQKHIGMSPSQYRIMKLGNFRV